MPSVWITTRTAKSGRKRHRVEYRLGGRGTRIRYAGSFKTMREATLRKAWVYGELAALRVPDLTLLHEPPPSPTLRDAAARWRATRVDAADSTRVFHETSLNRAFDVLGDR